MFVVQQVEREYDVVVEVYGNYLIFLFGCFEFQFVQIVLGDCRGMCIFDLGGGFGVYVCKVVEFGVVQVDVIDILIGMLSIGVVYEKIIGCENVMRYIYGDVFQLFFYFGFVVNSYDIIMGNWIFSFVDFIDMV